MLHPEQEPAIEQHVAQRAAPEGADESHRADADDVHVLPRRRSQARNRERDGRGYFNRQPNRCWSRGSRNPLVGHPDGSTP
jgi:hypothetical protein